MSQALEGIRIIDFTHDQAGPFVYHSVVDFPGLIVILILRFDYCASDRRF